MSPALLAVPDEIEYFSQTHYVCIYLTKGHGVEQWLRHYATSREVAGSIPDEVIFSIYLILPAALGRGVYSASNRNEYQKHKNKNVSRE
jgi:hypothetical protein